MIFFSETDIYIGNFVVSIDAVVQVIIPLMVVFFLEFVKWIKAGLIDWNKVLSLKRQFKVELGSYRRDLNLYILEFERLVHECTFMNSYKLNIKYIPIFTTEHFYELGLRDISNLYNDGILKNAINILYRFIFNKPFLAEKSKAVSRVFLTIKEIEVLNSHLYNDLNNARDKFNSLGREREKAEKRYNDYLLGIKTKLSHSVILSEFENEIYKESTRLFLKVQKNLKVNPMERYSEIVLPLLVFIRDELPGRLESVELVNILNDIGFYYESQKAVLDDSIQILSNLKFTYELRLKYITRLLKHL